MENKIQVRDRRVNFGFKLGRFEVGFYRRNSGAVAELNGTRYVAGDDHRSARGTLVQLGAIYIVVDRTGFREKSVFGVKKADEEVRLTSGVESLRISGSGGRIIVTPDTTVKDEIRIPLR